MKKILAISILAAILITASSCGNEPDSKGPADSGNTSALTTAAESEPEAVPVPVTLDEVHGFISSIRAEYDSASEITLSDGTVISVVPKPSGVTADSVASGETTAEEISAYATYVANIRRIVCDKLPTYFPEHNRIYFDESAETDVQLMFLDPAADGYDTAGEVFAKMISEENEGKVLTDYVSVQNGMAVYYDADKGSATVLCPTEEENAVLTAIAARMSADTQTAQAAE